MGGQKPIPCQQLPLEEHAEGPEKCAEEIQSPGTEGPQTTQLPGLQQVKKPPQTSNKPGKKQLQAAQQTLQRDRADAELNKEKGASWHIRWKV